VKFSCCHGGPSNRALFFGAWIFLAALCQAPDAEAHSELIIQIDAVTKEIAADPGNAELYVRRGQLRREHMEYEAAREDYDKALSLSPRLPGMDLLRGRLFLDWGWPLTSKAYLDRFLAQQPKSADGLVLRARVLTRLQQRLAAVGDYDKAITLFATPSPDLFVERAQMLQEEGPDHYAAVLKGLDDGIQKLGPLVTLQLFAIEVEIKAGNFDGALARVDKVTERSPRKETWLARRAEILQQAGRPEEAKLAYQSALAALKTLPPTRRNVPAMQELAKRIQREIENLGGPTGAATPPRQ